MKAPPIGNAVKLREIRTALRQDGFAMERKVGSHEQWIRRRDDTFRRVTLAGNQGDTLTPQNIRNVYRQAGWMTTNGKTPLPSSADATSDSPPASPLLQTDKAAVVAAAMTRPIVSVSKLYGVSVESIERWIAEAAEATARATRLTHAPFASLQQQHATSTQETSPMHAPATPPPIMPRASANTVAERLRAAARYALATPQASIHMAMTKYGCEHNSYRSMQLIRGICDVLDPETNKQLRKKYFDDAKKWKGIRRGDAEQERGLYEAFLRRTRQPIPKSPAGNDAFCKPHAEPPAAVVSLVPPAKSPDPKLQPAAEHTKPGEIAYLRAKVDYLELRLLEYMQRDMRAQMERAIGSME